MTGERRHFEEGGADYARHRPTYPPALADALADTCAATDHALDVGCGTGLNRPGFPGGPEIWKDGAHGNQDITDAIPGRATRAGGADGG